MLHLSKKILKDTHLINKKRNDFNGILIVAREQLNIFIQIA